MQNFLKMMRLIVCGILTIICLIVIYFYLSEKNNISEKRKHFNEILGRYRLDVLRTELGNYNIDSDFYSNLEIEFKSDSTFKLNMEAPFIYGNSGKWNVSGNRIDETNSLVFKNNNKIISQFSQLYMNKTDSIFYINSSTPKKGNAGIQKIFFIKKISR